jgi:hypothetical protein
MHHLDRGGENVVRKSIGITLATAWPGDGNGTAREELIAGRPVFDRFRTLLGFSVHCLFSRITELHLLEDTTWFTL